MRKPLTYRPSAGPLKRNVVLHVVELTRGFLWRRAFRFGRFGFHRVLTRLAAAFASPEHLHHVAADLGRVAVLAVFVLPLARAQASFNVDLRAFLQVFASDRSEAPEECDAVPLSRLLHLPARLVFPAVGG